MLRLPLILDVIASDGNEEDQEYLEDLGLSSIYLSVIFSGGEQYIVKHSLIDLAQKIAKAQ